MSKTKKKTGFTALISKFPKTILPVSLTPDAYRDFEKNNKPLSLDSVKNFLLDQQEEVDEFTEFIPCFRLPDTKKFYGLVYWQAGLMEYHYTLITFDKKGQLVNKKRIAGTIPQQNMFNITVADVESCWKIELKEGNSDANAKNLMPSSFSRYHQLTISEDGNIHSNEF